MKRFMNRLIQKRAGRLPVFAMVVGDELSDDVMFEVRVRYILVIMMSMMKMMMMKAMSHLSSTTHRKLMRLFLIRYFKEIIEKFFLM